MNDTVLFYLASFFIYSIIGWLWETFYCSIRKKELVNRGFLYGPWLPIYGFGALIILFSTASFKESTVMVFLIGMLSASCLEYCTGWLMEAIFHVRYWDYSNEPYNLHGHICLFVSFAWGIASVLLVKLVHPPIEKMITGLSLTTLKITTVILMIFFVFDVIESVINALNLKKLLHSITEQKDTFHTAEKTIETALSTIKEQLDTIENRIQEAKTQIQQDKMRLDAKSSKQYLLKKLSEYKENEMNALNELEKKTQSLLNRLENQEFIDEKVGALRKSLQSTNEVIQQMKQASNNRHVKQYQKAISMLERNPTSISKRYQSALNELSELKKRRMNK